MMLHVCNVILNQEAQRDRSSCNDSSVHQCAFLDVGDRPRDMPVQGGPASEDL